MKSAVDYIMFFKFLCGSIGFLVGIILLVAGIIRGNIDWRKKGVIVIVSTFVLLLLVLGIQTLLV